MNWESDTIIDDGRDNDKFEGLDGKTTSVKETCLEEVDAMVGRRRQQTCTNMLL